ncbi:hypothetical protein ACRRTK_000889 [Alexandromys fortis]
MSDYLWFEGIPFSAFLNDKETLDKVSDKFVVRDEDTIILTYPKSGTNWLIEIVCLIQTKGNPQWIQSVPIWERSPWVEYKDGYQTLTNQEGPRLISSHLPFHLFPKSFFSSKAKDTRGTIEKICDFLGKKLEKEELDLVLKYSSFQVMKENKMSNLSLVPEDVAPNGLHLMRKGMTGDWKNHFTVAQAEAFDKVFQEKMIGFPPELFPWQ